MRLWWEGSGKMSVRSDRYGLVFKLEADGSTTEQELPAPVAPMKPSEYLAFLAANVKDRDGSIDQLNGRLIAEEGDEEEDGRPDEDYELPPGATFAAHGDTEETQAKRREESAKFKELGSNSDSKFILHHAPKAMRAIRFVPSGPIENPFDIDEGDLVPREADNGYLYAHDQLTGRASETIMSYAADVAAFLCMAGASHMVDAGAPDAPTPVFQVLRNWSLDRRRINEWKMLVAGGAVSEKPNGPATYDPTMLHGRFAPADTGSMAPPDERRDRGRVGGGGDRRRRDHAQGGLGAAVAQMARTRAPGRPEPDRSERPPVPRLADQPAAEPRDGLPARPARSGLRRRRQPCPSSPSSKRSAPSSRVRRD